MVPFLPPDTSKADLPYSRYEQIRTYMDQNPTIPELPESCTTEIDTLHKDTLIGYSNYFSLPTQSVWPEWMMKSKTPLLVRFCNELSQIMKLHKCGTFIYYQ